VPCRTLIMLFQTEYLFCLILSIHSDGSMRKASSWELAIFYRNV
jgi:hypothetical protein